MLSREGQQSFTDEKTVIPATSHKVRPKKSSISRGRAWYCNDDDDDVMVCYFRPLLPQNVNAANFSGFAKKEPPKDQM